MKGEITKYLLTAALVWAILPVESGAQVKSKTTSPTRAKAAAAKPVPASKASIEAGKVVYTESCVTCHQADGGGVGNLNPPLIKTSYVLGDKPLLINIILQGMNGVEVDGEMYHNAMPAFAYLTNKQIADVLSYVRSSFGNNASAVRAAEVAKQRAKK